MIRSAVRALPVFAVATAAVLHSVRPHAADGAALCTIAPPATIALVTVQKDTVLPFSPAAFQLGSFSSVRPSESDTLLAGLDTEMPAGRVQLLDVDPGTRTALLSEGITDEQPVVYLRAAPYRADCRTIRWTDTVPFLVPGETGYVRGTLQPRDRWIGDVPVIAVPEVWYYPYPRRRGLAWRAPVTAPLAPADALFSANLALQMFGDWRPGEPRIADTVRRQLAMEWARANLTAAELEPVRGMLRSAILGPDWREAELMPSRLRGTYHVLLTSAGDTAQFYFRTHDRPGYSWHGGDSLQRTAELLESPHVLGYQLVGIAATARDSLPGAHPRLPERGPLVWLSVNDRPTTPSNEGRRALTGDLLFMLGAAPRDAWELLEPLAQPLPPQEAQLLERMRRPMPPEERRVRLPVALLLGNDGTVRLDSSYDAGARRVHLSAERIDTLTLRRPF